MQLKEDKRGIPRSIIAILIIFSFFASVGILFLAINSFIRGGSVPLGDSSFNLKIENVQIIDNELFFTLKRNLGGGTFVGLNFEFCDGSKSESFKEKVSVEEFGMKSFNFTFKKIDPNNLQNITVLPTIALKSGREVKGDVGYTWDSPSDIYRCTSNCTDKICGDNGCKGSCGGCSGEMVCSLGKCVISCVDTCSSLGHECDEVCGKNCGNCFNSHGSNSCIEGKCNPVCSAGYDNCDNNRTNGCETQLGTDLNCASCGNVCIGGNVCTKGVCSVPCIDTCTSLNYSCGVHTICGNKVLCGIC